MTDYSKLAYSCLFLYITICTYKDLCVQTSPEKQIPITKVGLNTNIGPTLKFFYCYSCGYRKVFEDYANIIRQKYPEISITGSNYDPPGIHMLIARVLGLLKMVVIISILSGINLFNKFGIETPSWWTWCTENKIWSCMMIFFMTNALEGHFISTGAFEILLNVNGSKLCTLEEHLLIPVESVSGDSPIILAIDIPVWSKLETGRIPQPPELFQIIDNHMLLDDPMEPMKPGFFKIKN